MWCTGPRVPTEQGRPEKAWWSIWVYFVCLLLHLVPFVLVERRGVPGACYPITVIPLDYRLPWREDRGPEGCSWQLNEPVPMPHHFELYSYMSQGSEPWSGHCRDQERNGLLKALKISSCCTHRHTSTVMEHLWAGTREDGGISLVESEERNEWWLAEVVGSNPCTKSPEHTKLCPPMGGKVLSRNGVLCSLKPCSYVPSLVGVIGVVYRQNEAKSTPRCASEYKIHFVEISNQEF